MRPSTPRKHGLPWPEAMAKLFVAAGSDWLLQEQRFTLWGRINGHALGLT
jgi:hypothetical protein